MKNYIGPVITVVVGWAVCGALMAGSMALADERVTKEESEQAKVIAQLVGRIESLERKVKGIQKQISVLHTKKADKI